MLVGRTRPAALVAGLLSVVYACGARTELRGGAFERGGEGGEGAPVAGAGGAGGEPAPECVSALDCPSDDRCVPQACLEGQCVALAPIDCSDADPCTIDRCDPSSGACSNEAPVDGDGDGYVAAVAGAPGCGDDCDDDDAAVNPGAGELCDGKDNDCDAAIDEGAGLTYTGFEPVRVSGLDLERAGRGGLSLGAQSLGVTYTGLSGSRWRSYFVELDVAGAALGEKKLVNDINADSYAGALLWAGDRFATAWSDARQDGNYEVYFNHLSAQGDKLGADQRLSDAPDFSLHASLIELGDGYLVAWDDRRFEDGGGAPVLIYARSIAADGTPGEERVLTEDDELAEYPALAATQARVGLAYTVIDAGQVQARFRTFDHALGGASDAVDLGAPGAQEPSVIAVGGRFVVIWQTYDVGPGDTINAALVSASGVVERLGASITSGASFARSHAALSLGDRFVLIWADDHDGNYELYSQVLDAELNVLRPRERITFDGADTLSPAATLLEGGGVGIVFDDWRSGPRQVYYTRLDCAAP